MSGVCKLMKYLVSLFICCKKSTISEIIIESVNDVFAECDRSSLIKNFTNRLNLGELQVDNISAKFTAES